jgi:hypothetical protein
MMLSQASYRGGGLAAPLATLTVVNPVVAAAVGITMFGETFRYGETGTVLALACGVVAAGGLILLTTEQIGSARHTAEVAAPAAAVAEPEPEPATPDSAFEALLLTALPEQSTGPVREAATAADRGEAFVGLGEAFGSDLEEAFGSGLEDEFGAAVGDGFGAGLGDGFGADRGEDVFVPAPVTVGAAESASGSSDSPESSEEDAPPPLAYFGPLCGPYVVATPLLDHHRTRVKS